MVKRGGSMVEMEAVYLDPGAVEGLFPVDGVSGNLLRCRISQLWEMMIKYTPVSEGGLTSVT